MPIDYKKYPENWLSEIRPRIMERAKGLCENCKLKHGATVYSIKLCVKDGEGKYKQKAIWFRHEQDAIREASDYSPPKKVKVCLTIAHLDHDELNHDVKDERLKALCQICHLRYDAVEKYRRAEQKYLYVSE